MENYTHSKGIDPKSYHIWHNGYMLLHRTDGPAVIHLYGTICFYIYGKRHRNKLPAIEYYSSITKKLWYHTYFKNNLKHRFNAPAHINFVDNYREYYHFDKIIQGKQYA